MSGRCGFDYLKVPDLCCPARFIAPFMQLDESLQNCKFEVHRITMQFLCADIRPCAVMPLSLWQRIVVWSRDPVHNMVELISFFIHDYFIRILRLRFPKFYVSEKEISFRINFCILKICEVQSNLCRWKKYAMFFFLLRQNYPVKRQFSHVVSMLHVDVGAPNSVLDSSVHCHTGILSSII